MVKKNNFYSTQTDISLVQLYKNGDIGAFDELAVRYRGKISFIARKYSAQGYDQNDFVQEGLLGLVSACNSYDESSGSSFKSYLSIVVERRFISIIRRFNNQKAVPDSALVQIDGLDNELEDSSGSPEKLLLEKEELKLITQRLKTLLSEREYTVFAFYVSGLSYAQISKRLGITEKSVDNALQRVRRKAGCLY